jgi:uncharacterized membrane protein YcgQ (UPF0703/DUF1980 family)
MENHVFKKSNIRVKVYIIAITLILSGCVKETNIESAAITIPEGKQLITMRGYAGLKGQSALYPDSDVGKTQSAYQRSLQYGESKMTIDNRCHTLVSYDGWKQRRRYNKLDGKYVEVQGFVLSIAELDEGPSQSDNFMGRKYYKDMLFVNSCYKEEAFIVTSMALLPQ